MNVHIFIIIMKINGITIAEYKNDHTAAACVHIKWSTTYNGACKIMTQWLGTAAILPYIIHELIIMYIIAMTYIIIMWLSENNYIMCMYTCI